MLKVTLFNAAPDTGNLGVTALGYSIIAGLAQRIPNLSLTVADCGLGMRPAKLSVDGVDFPYMRCGVRMSRRLYRSEAMWNIRLAAKLGGAWNSIARHLMDQDFCLDITGGDSFSDLYGSRQFQSCAEVKKLSLEWKIPLGLLPQTYGPFDNPEYRRIAVELIRQSEFAWARDERSFRELQNLLGDRFDFERHHCGVDVAFLLEPIQPAVGDLSKSPALGWLADTSRPTLGLNVSGLIYNDPESAVRQYKFVADYRQAMKEFIQRLLTQSDANILLIPHVIAPIGHVQSDYGACLELCQMFVDQWPERLAVLPELKDPRHVKWVISQCDWFCGTRMHATIAGLSTRVPTAAVAYSLKTAGVFETCDQGDNVADPRELSTSEVIDKLWQSWLSRDKAAKSLAIAVPRVLEQANRQMDMIANACQNSGVSTPVGTVKA